MQRVLDNDPAARNKLEVLILYPSVHALVEGGGNKKVKPTEYREGQNVITDSLSGNIVYMPPEAKDVPILMKECI